MYSDLRAMLEEMQYRLEVKIAQVRQDESEITELRLNKYLLLLVVSMILSQLPQRHPTSL
jgi:hypothetical protein